MWLQRKAQYIRNQIAKDYNLEGDYERIGYIMGSITDELYHKYEERYYKYLMKHIHPVQPNLHCSAPQLDTRCICAKCTAKYGLKEPEDLGEVTSISGEYIIDGERIKFDVKELEKTVDSIHKMNEETPSEKYRRILEMRGD